jgi:peptidoglycan/LPS O-acetylase OafA/YrhL
VQALSKEREHFGERRLSQLDGLRAVAVGGVLIEHGLGVVHFSQNDSGLALGAFGVRLFFVLSGFLITGILLNARSEAEVWSAPRWRIWTAFYCRRAVRILPLGYLVLILAWLAGAPSIRTHPWVYATYTSNYVTAKAGFVDPTLDHFWSLAIEEQFYLFWPLLVLAIPKRWVSGAMAAVVVVALVARARILVDYGAQAAYVLTPSRLDALAVGGLLAWSAVWWRSKVVTSGVALCVLGIAARIAPMLSPDSEWVRAVPELGNVLISAAIVMWAANGIGGILGRVLSSPVAVFVGTISYGIYVYHRAIAGIVVLVGSQFGLQNLYPSQFGWPRLIWLVATSLPIATLSWFLFEKPLNDLKRHFPYVEKRQVVRAERDKVLTMG